VNGSANSGEPLAARLVAIRALAGVMAGQSLEPALEVAGLGSRDTALARNLAYEGARWFHRLEAILQPMLRKPLGKKDARLKALLIIALVQLERLRIPDHAAVTTAVDAARALGYGGRTGFINAVLRRFLREREALQPSADDPGAFYSHPGWMIEAFASDWPDHWQAIVDGNNQSPPMALRVNRQRRTRDAYLEALAKAGIEAAPVAQLADAVLLTKPVPSARLPGISAGLVSIQDLGAQLAADYLGLQPGQRVLDACAAPGNKAAHILEREPEIAGLVAVDVDAQRLATLTANLGRLGLVADVRLGDASQPDQWWDGQPFERILVDAPCSATGVIRRHPDIKLLRKSDDIAQFQRRQKALLDAVWPLLAPGGRLVYCTCSVLTAENRSQIKAFLASNTDAQLTGLAPSGDRQIRPGEANMDGFYYACLEKVGE
jgi:16S rRNA (cytosine967-C5)-methyltransferase